MNKFLSSDRKVLLQSAIVGTGIIAALYNILLLDTDSLILWISSILGLIAVYWYIPSWFFRNRQLEKIEINLNPKNAGNNPVKKLSDKEIIISIACGIFINILLIFIVYPTLVHTLIDIFPTYSDNITSILIVLAVITPYLTRHIYCFILNRPINNFSTLNWTYSHYPKRNNIGFPNTASNPSYSYLSYNIHHRR